MLFWCVDFAVPIVVMCAIAISRGIYPFGDVSFLADDLMYQYIDFFSWFKRVLAGQTSVFYSATCGLGANTWGLYSYYLASPFNLLILAFDQSHLTLFVFVLVVLKMGCVQLSATFYLHRRFGLSRRCSALLALGYTFSLWAMTNLRNPMWLDALILLPLAMWAVWILVERGRWLPLALFTALDVICCWYTAYMTVLFLIMLTVLEWRCSNCGDASQDSCGKLPLWHLALRFARPMLLALALSAWTFIPTVLAMLESGASDETSLLGILQGIAHAGGPTLALRRLFATTPVYLLRGLVPAVYDKAHAIPQLYSGLVPTASTALLFVSRHVDGRTKRSTGVFFLVLLSSVVLSPLEAIWCGFRAPTGFFSRVSIFVAPSVMWAAGTYWAAMARRGASSSGVFSRRGLPRLIVAGLVLIDAFLTGFFAWRTIYGGLRQADFESYVEQSSDQVSWLRDRDDGFWRLDRTYTRADLAALNEGLARGYMGLSSYSSAHDQNALDFLGALGYSRKGQISVRYASPIPLSDSLLGVRYVSSEKGLAWLSLVHEAPEVGSTSLYCDASSLGLGYLVSPTAVEAELPSDENPFECQNAFASALVGHSVEVFHKADASLESCDGTSKTWRVTTPADSLGFAYLEAPETLEDGAILTTDGLSELEHWRFQHCVRAFSEVEGDAGGVHEVSVSGISDSSAATGSKVSIDDVGCDFYYLDFDALDDVIEQLSKHELTMDSCGGGEVVGSVESDEDGWLMVSVPHEGGWSVKVNGEAVETSGAFRDALTLVPVTAGTNYVTMSFISPGLEQGCAISISAIACLMIWMSWRFLRSHMVL